MLTYARFSLDGRLIAAALRYSVPMVPQLVSHWILNFSDRIVLERFVSMAEVGIYSAGYTLGWSLSFVRMGLAQAMIPLYGSSDPTNPNHVASLARATTLYMSAMCVGAMLLGVLGVDVVAWLSPESYASAGEVMRVVSVAALFFGLYNPAVQVINITLGRTVAVALITMSGAALNLALNLVVVPRVGMIGAAFTTAVSYLAVALVTLRTATAMGRVPYDTPRLAGLIVTAVLAVATAWAVMPTTMGGRILADAVILVSAFAILLRTRLIDLAELRRLAAGSGAVRPGEGS
jgi:O-antigen/teichoic acid export membrane protein